VILRDVYPPAVPQSLVAAVLRPDPNAPPEVDLSWSINTETDLAGYRVYRSEQHDTPGQLLTPDLLPSPAYRDTSVQPGHLYWYSVTAVDRSGNESAPSAPVAAEVAQPSS
jgi:fibronectin type 3 domain-containing protein